MRLFQVYLSAEFSGSERHAIELANGLAARHQTHLVVRRLRPDHPARERLLALRQPDVDLIEIPSWGAGASMRLEALRHRPAIVHAHNSRAARLACRWLAGRPSVATLHVGYRERAHRHCSWLLCLTEEQRQALPEEQRGRASVAENWVVPHRRLGAGEIEALRAGLGAGPSTFVVGAAGRLAPEKGFLTLIQAMQAAAIEDGLLVIAGDGPERQRLHAVAGPETRLLGFRHDVRNLYQAFDVFVMPSLREHYGLVLLEAMEAGIPVISTATIGGTHILRGQPSGQLVPVDDPGALAAALRRARHEHGQHPTYRLEPFSLAKRLEIIEALYERLVSFPS